MPIHDLKCPTCGMIIEDVSHVSSDNKVLCPKCDTEMNYMIGRVTHRFKGAGFYETDYKSKPAHSEDTL
jgi:putative FmdB family regulatory protein